MNKYSLIFSLLAVVLGASLFVYGGYDDSPGGQLLGLVITVIGVVFVIKKRKKDSI